MGIIGWKINKKGWFSTVCWRLFLRREKLRTQSVSLPPNPCMDISARLQVQRTKRRWGWLMAAPLLSQRGKHRAGGDKHTRSRGSWSWSPVHVPPRGNKMVTIQTVFPAVMGQEDSQPASWTSHACQEQMWTQLSETHGWVFSLYVDHSTIMWTPQTELWVYTIVKLETVTVHGWC